MSRGQARVCFSLLSEAVSPYTHTLRSRCATSRLFCGMRRVVVRLAELLLLVFWQISVQFYQLARSMKSALLHRRGSNQNSQLSKNSVCAAQCQDERGMLQLQDCLCLVSNLCTSVHCCIVFSAKNQRSDCSFSLPVADFHTRM